jgi:putative drug exporter of the RND superfamily
MDKVARLAIAAPRRIVAVALLVMVGTGIFGVPCVKNLSGGGSRDPGSESAQAAALLAKKFHRTDSVMLITLRSQDNVSDDLVRDRDGVTVRAEGSAAADAPVAEQTDKDLLLMETVAIPVSLLVLVAAFGGLFAAALPVFVTGLAIMGSMAALRAISHVADVSTFALNVAIAIGLALAINNTLLILSRYRDELAGGSSRDQALVYTMATAGRTVLCSGAIVTLSMLPMLLFPMYLLKSFAYAGATVGAFATIGAFILTPALIALLGDRIDSLDVRRLFRHRRAGPTPQHVEQTFWYRSTKWVIRHAVPAGLAVFTLLVVLGAPLLGVRNSTTHDRVLPTSASAHHVGGTLPTEFATNSATNVNVVIPDTTGVTREELSGYAARLSLVPDVSWVSSPVGTFVGGQQTGPPTGTSAIADGSAYLTVASSAPLFSDTSQTQLDRLHAVGRPTGAHVQLAGAAQTNRDTGAAVTKRLPLVLTLIAVISTVLLFLLTGSIVVPLKALALNVLLLGATFGALVWIFGHLGALGTTHASTLDLHMPLLLFCVAFGLSMVYEVFLISRIREYWLSSEQTRLDNDESVALGLARTSTVITAAALVVSIAFAALMAPQVSFMRMFGVGLTVAILVDATLVRLILVPAFMHMLGRANWWAPRPLARLHNRVALADSVSYGRHAAPNILGHRSGREVTLGSPSCDLDHSPQRPGRHQRDRPPGDPSIRRRVRLGAHHDGHSDLRSRQERFARRHVIGVRAG